MRQKTTLYVTKTQEKLNSLKLPWKKRSCFLEAIESVKQIKKTIAKRELRKDEWWGYFNFPFKMRKKTRKEDSFAKGLSCNIKWSIIRANCASDCAYSANKWYPDKSCFVFCSRIPYVVNAVGLFLFSQISSVSIQWERTKIWYVNWKNSSLLTFQLNQ